MMKFWEEHEADRDRFAMVAFHDDSVQDFAELDGKLKEKEIPDKYWDGKQLPFPVFLDKTGKTIEQWGIRAFPTVVLVDPEGRLVGQAHTETLAQALRGELELPWTERDGGKDGR